MVATDGDNTNVVIGQVLQKRYEIGTVVVRVLDPARAKFYADRGPAHRVPDPDRDLLLLETVRAAARLGSVAS